MATSRRNAQRLDFLTGTTACAQGCSARAIGLVRSPACGGELGHARQGVTPLKLVALN